MADLRIPKSLSPDAVLWAFRHGVVMAMMYRGRLGPVRRHRMALVMAPRSVLQLSARIAREWSRRHPVSADSGTGGDDA